MCEQLQTADIEIQDGTNMTISMPAFRQVILNPDGSIGEPDRSIATNS